RIPSVHRVGVCGAEEFAEIRDATVHSCDLVLLMITDPKVPGEEVALDRADPALPRVDQGESGLEEGEVLFDRAHRTPVRPEHVRGRGHQGPVLLDDQPDMAPGITDEHLALRA